MPVTVTIQELSDALGLEILAAGGGSVNFRESEINRPGLQLTGYYEHFAAQRVQLIGNAEMHYLYGLPEAEIYARMSRLMSFKIPCIVCARNNHPPMALLKSAEDHGVPVLKSKLQTGEIGHRISEYIELRLAPKILLHGVLLDVFGVGMLLTGESGLGKSETALELIKAGHRLVADDVVEITRARNDALVGRAPEATRHLVEVRGIGVVDVRYLYGVGAVIQQKEIDLVMEMELWNENAKYERVSAFEASREILGVNVPCTMLPVSPGRNLAVVVEVAARSFRLKRLGYDMGRELKSRAPELF
ncbi:MAG: HPr(Ser) kinase/phosphatase [Clostridiaceae bacterium]|nr:HPr(Ser) kinase/phosphatase [Eubacteriales bacterium]